jgi:hypothetical protein
MKNLCLIALLPALTCAFLLPVPPLFHNEISVSSHASHTSHASHIEAKYADTNAKPTAMTGAEIKEICTIVHFAELELCGNTSSSSNHNPIPPQLCSILSLMNHTFCQDEKGERREKGEKHVNENRNTESNISEKTENIIEKFYSNVYIEDIKNNNTNLNPKDLCPIFDLVDKTFCASASDNNKLNPKDLCPLLEFVEKELCT